LGAIGTFTAKPLLAQIRAVLVQNVDEPGRTPYLSFADLSTCFKLVPCVAPFGPLPSGKRLVATNITGEVFLETPGTILSACLFPATYYCFPTVQQIAVTGGPGPIGINVGISLFMDGPAQPSVFFRSTSIFEFSAFGDQGVALSGYLVDCSSPGSCAATVH
jgi:hypothetical protein